MELKTQWKHDTREHITNGNVPISEGRLETMKIYSEQSLQNFGFWSGARDTASELTGNELDRIEAELEAIYPDGMDETAINDIFWFEQDWIAEMLGYECWEHLEADHAGRDWKNEEEEEEEEE